MKYSLGFIGCGNMGRAMLAGALNAGLTTPERISVHTHAAAHQQKIAADYGVQRAVVIHGFPSAGVFDVFSHDIDVFLALARRLHGSGVGLNFDNANATGCGVDAVALLETLYEDVVSVHLTDTASDKTTLHTALGAGISPVREVLSVLKRRGFSGLITIEEDSHRGELGVFQAIAHVRGIWNSL